MPTPPANAKNTTLQIGTYTPLTDTFTLVLDLNDGATWWIGNGKLKLPQPDKVDNRSFNLRTAGERVVRTQYKNRHIQVSVNLRGASTTAMLTSIRALIAAIEHPDTNPYSIRLALPGATLYSYADVVRVKHTIPADPLALLALAIPHIEIDFECRPFLRGDRVVLSNLVPNPGFEAPFGGGIAQSAPVAFADPLTTLHAYGDPGYEAAVLQDSPLRYYPMDELAGTVCDDLGSTATNGTYTGGVTLGVSPGVSSGGGDTAVTLNGTSGYITSATTGLPSGNAAVTVEAWLKLASAYTAGTNAILADLGATGAGNHWQLGLTATTGKPFFSNGGTGVVTAAAALSTGAWHHLVGTWDGTTATLYVDGSSAATATPGAMTVGTTAFIIGASQSIGAFLPATVDDAAVYGTTLSAARVSAHFTAASAANQPILAPPNLYPDAVLQNCPAGSLQRYYRLDESSGTSAFDIGGTGQTGTTHGSPTQGVAGLLAVDTDTCYTFASGSSQFITAPGTGLPTGNSAFSYAVWFKFASNPASNSTLFYYGGTASKSGSSLWIDSSGKLNCDVLLGTGQITSTLAVTTATPHLAVVTWNGTTLTLYLDGASVGTPTTPGALSLVTTNYIIGDNNTTAYYSGQLDEQTFYSAALTSGQVSALYTAGHGGTAGTLSNAMLIPASTLLQFGSPAWGAMQTWQMRFRYTTSLTLRLYLHYTDATHNLFAQLFSGANGLGLFQNIAGVVNTLGQVTTPALTFESWYWLQVTQFPAATGSLPYIQATLLSDNNGAVGSQVGSATVGGFTTDAVTALSGTAAITASGASLVIGGEGNSAGAGQQVSLFGPAGWIGSPAAGNAPAALAWEQNTSNTAPIGTTNSGNGGNAQVPVTSFGSARIDAPSVGGSGWTGVWQSGNPASLTTLQQSAIPVAAGGDVLQFTGMLKATGIGTGYRAYLQVNEYNASGTLVGAPTQHTLASGSGAVPWQAWQFSMTTQGTTAFAILALVALDAGSSSTNSTTWWDNVQAWDQTASGMAAMPYCELRFPSSPAQLLVSGLRGDGLAPAVVECGLYCSSFPQGNTITIYLGRRALVTANAVLVSPGWTYLPPFTTAVLDAPSYGGFYLATSIGNSDIQNISTQATGGIPAIADILGTYAVFSRLWTADVTPTAVWVSAYNDVELGSQMASLARTDLITRVQSARVFPFTASSTWTIVNAGKGIVPPASLSGLTDPTKTFERIFTGITGSSSTRYAFRSGFHALIPVDSDLYIGTLINPAGANYAVTAQWLYCYIDDTTFSSTFSVENASLPNAAHAGGTPGTTSSVALNVNPGADPGLHLDPLQRLGGAITGSNQFALLAADNTATLLGCAVDLAYSPQYLYPA